MLTAQNASYLHRSGAGVHETSLELGPGITGLVGPNGAGKSTLMSVLSGALLPQTGSVRVDGVDLYGANRAAALAAVALMPQGFSPLPLLSVERFILLFAWLRGVDSRIAQQRTEEALVAVGLSARRRASLKSLSGGMMRRCLLAQALVAHPKVLILDEPTVGLDPHHRSEIRDLIAGLADRTVLISSHLLDDVGMLADRVLVMHEGQVLLDSPRHALPQDSQALEQEVIRITRSGATG